MEGRGLQPSKTLGLSVLTLFEAVGLENEKGRMEKKQGSSFYPLTIPHANPVICPYLQITERLELVTLPWSSALMAIETI